MYSNMLVNLFGYGGAHWDVYTLDFVGSLECVRASTCVVAFWQGTWFVGTRSNSLFLMNQLATQTFVAMYLIEYCVVQ